MFDSASSMHNPMNCFLIDDDIDDQEIFAMAIREFSESIQCFFADDGVKAVAKFHQDDSFLPNYIFIDINMPRMDGIECFQQIRNIQRLDPVPVCMLSTSADPAIVARSKELGATDFIVKPASISVLSELLRNFFDSNQLIK